MSNGNRGRKKVIEAGLYRLKLSQFRHNPLILVSGIVEFQRASSPVRSRSYVCSIIDMPEEVRDGDSYQKMTEKFSANIAPVLGGTVVKCLVQNFRRLE